MAGMRAVRRGLVSVCAAAALAVTMPGATAAVGAVGGGPQWVQENEVTFQSGGTSRFEDPLVAEFYPEGLSPGDRGSIDMYDVVNERDGMFYAPENEPLDTPGYQAPDYDHPDVSVGVDKRRAIRLDAGTGRVWNLGADEPAGTPVWSTDQFRSHRTTLGVKAPHGAKTLAVDPVHHVLVTGGSDFLAFLAYDGTARRTAQVAVPGDGPLAVDPAAGRVYLLDTSAEPARLRVFDTTTGAEQHALVLPAGAGKAWTIRWDAAAGNVLVPTGGRLIVVHAADGTTRSVALGPHADSVDIDRDSHRAFVGGFGNTLYQVDLNTFTLEHQYPLKHQSPHVFVNQRTHDVWTVGTYAAGDNGGIIGLVKKP